MFEGSLGCALTTLIHGSKHYSFIALHSLQKMLRRLYVSWFLDPELPVGDDRRQIPQSIIDWRIQWKNDTQGDEAKRAKGDCPLHSQQGE